MKSIEQKASRTITSAHASSEAATVALSDLDLALQDLRDNIAAVPISDSSLSYLASNVLYARGSMAKEVRREAVVAIKTLRSILYAARDPALSSEAPTPQSGEAVPALSATDTPSKATQP